MSTIFETNKLVFFSFLGLICFFIDFNTMAQEYKIRHTEIKFIDQSRNNRQIKTDVYYPSIISEKGKEFTGKESFPVVCFGHGFVMPAKSYKNIWKVLVPEA